MVEESLLWERAREGDADALEELLERAGSQARSVLMGKCIPEGDRDDLVGEICLSTLEFLHRVEECPRNLRGFLYYRVRAVLKDYWRCCSRRTRTLVALPAEEEPEDPRGLLDGLHEKSLLRFHQECVQDLPPILERVYRMRALEGVSQVEIARRLQKSEVWVHRRLSDARARILAQLRANGFCAEESP